MTERDLTRIHTRLIYSVGLVSGVQQSDSIPHICIYTCIHILYIYTLFFRLLSILVYYNILDIFPCAIQ